MHHLRDSIIVAKVGIVQARDPQNPPGAPYLNFEMWDIVRSTTALLNAPP